MWFDSHCHLDHAVFAVDRAEVIAAAQAVGVSASLLPSVGAWNFAAVHQLAHVHHGFCLPAYGLHPLYADKHTAADVHALGVQLALGGAYAVGEIGLDGMPHMPLMDTQVRFFEVQLALARQHDLPVIIHSRHAVDQVLKYLRRANVRCGFAHAFNGSFQQAAQLIDLGFVLGFGGLLSYPRAQQIHRLAAQLPMDSLVLETDAPDMSPSFARGVRNSPIHVPQFGALLAQMRGVPVADIADQTTANVWRVLGRSAGVSF